MYTIKNHSVKRTSLTRQLSQKSCAAVMDAPTDRPSDLVDNMVTLLSYPRRNAEQYTSSRSFAVDLIAIAQEATKVLAKEKRLIHLSSPVYAFGDIHGNLTDLQFFSQNLWSFGMPAAAGHYLFLGDYVDRGPKSLEVVAYLLALKLSCPNKVTLLRGNHELRRVNGWEAWYGAGSFIAQCKARFGDTIGATVWEECNRAFDCMPLAATVDGNVFCSHGGVPRHVPVPAKLAVRAPPMSAASTVSMASSTDASFASGTPTSARSAAFMGRSPRTPRTLSSEFLPFTPPDLRLHAIEHAPVPLKLLVIPPKPDELAPPGTPPTAAAGSATCAAGSGSGSGFGSGSGSTLTAATPTPVVPREGPAAAPAEEGGGSDLVSSQAAARVALDLLWADPASPDQECNGHLDANGFGVGLRGGDTICFGEAAIDDFMKRNNFQVLVRAHQATASGVGVSKGARVITVFSTSTDHGLGASATCGCILIEGGSITPIVRSEAYTLGHSRASAAAPAAPSPAAAPASASSASSGAGVASSSSLGGASPAARLTTVVVEAKESNKSVPLLRPSTAPHAFGGAPAATGGGTGEAKADTGKADDNANANNGAAWPATASKSHRVAPQAPRQQAFNPVTSAALVAKQMTTLSLSGPPSPRRSRSPRSPKGMRPSSASVVSAAAPSTTMNTSPRTDTKSKSDKKRVPLQRRRSSSSEAVLPL